MKFEYTGTLSSNEQYIAPDCSVIELDTDTVLCQSGNTEDYDIYDPWA